MKTLVNFRDIGGYKTKEGKLVKNGFIYRSGEITHLSKDDHQSFEQQYNIRTIFDFRGEDEREKSPNETFKSVQTVALDILKDSEGNSAGLEDLVKGSSHAGEYMKEVYRDFILTESSREGYHVFLEDIARLDDPFIFHCFAGKDRTGFGAALILSLLEVDKKDIYHDYLLSNKMREHANQTLLQGMKAQGMDDRSLEMVKVMMEVQPEYLDESFNTIEKEFGTVHNFVKDGLDVTKDVVELIQHKYTIA